VKRIILKRLLLLAAMATMVLAVAIPAVAGGGNSSTSQSVDGVSQDSESEAESGEVDQSFEVTGGGDSSNQCAGVQGVGNTVSQLGGASIAQYNSEVDDFAFEEVGGSSLNFMQVNSEVDNFEFDEVGGPLTVDGTNETTCDQQAEQTASASG
jgi:hypothetical protein